MTPRQDNVASVPCPKFEDFPRRIAIANGLGMEKEGVATGRSKGHGVKDGRRDQRLALDECIVLVEERGGVGRRNVAVGISHWGESAKDPLEGAVG